MSGDSLTSLISLIPTLLALVIIAINMGLGLWRGFRKSVILSIQYVVSILVGIVVFFSTVSITYSNDLGGMLSSLGPDYANAKSLPEVLGVLLQTTLPNYAGLANNAYLQQFVFAIAGLVINLVLALICLVLIPLLVRGILYLLYLFLYPERKIKKSKGDEYKPRRLLGMAVGAARGLVCAVLTVSFVTSTYFVLSGGISTNEKAAKIELFDNLSSTIGVDVDAVYQGLKKSRTTGVGAIFDFIKFDGTPIDLAYTDLFLSSTFTSPRVKEAEIVGLSQYLSSEEVLEGEIAKLSLQAEGALLFNLIYDILETNAIKIVDGQVKVDRTSLDSNIADMVDEYINGSVVFSDLTPLLIIGVADAINKGEIEVDASIKELFTEDTIEEIKSINFAKDLSSLFRVAITAVELIPVNEETDDFDLEALKDPNTLLSFDVDKVKGIFEDLSKVEMLTEVVFPIGVGMSITTINEKLEEAGINPEELNFSETDWSFELKNLGNIYEKVVVLDLDINKLTDQSLNEETGLSNSLQYIIDLCNDETIVEGVEKSEIFKENLTSLIDALFDSNLLSQVGLVFMKSEIAKLEFKYDDGTYSPLNTSMDMVKDNLANYSKASLKADLKELVSSCLDVTSLIQVFMGNDSDLFGKIYDIETETLRSALLGVEDEEGNRKGGIYDLRLLSGDLDGDGNTDEGCKFATDSFVENALITYAQDVISPNIVDSITTVDDPTDENYDFDAWPNELNALIDAIADLQTINEDILTGINMESSELSEILPEGLTNDNVDVISGAASKSKLLSGVIVDKLISNLKDDPTLGSTVSNPEIKWMDTFIENEEGDLVVKERGEFNNVLKAFIVFSDEDKGIDLENPDSLINGLAKLLKPATSESLSSNVLDDVDYEEVNYFARSQVIMTALSSKISEVGNGSESGFSVVVPSKLNTEENPDAWKYWSYDNEINYDHKNGEFAKLVLVLYNAREYAVDNSTDTENPGLTKDNLLDSLVNMGGEDETKDDSIVGSLVLYATMSNELTKQSGPNDTNNPSIIKFRKKAKVENPATNNGIEIVDEEITKALKVIRNLNIDLTTNGLSKIGINSVLEAIKDEEARQSICDSNIFNITLINKITEADQISVPGKYKDANDEIDLEDSDWYPVDNWQEIGENAWKNCELNRLLLSVCEINIGDDDSDGVVDMLSTQQLLVDLNKQSDYTDKETKLDVIYDSDILSLTVHNKVKEQEGKGMVIRQAAYDMETGLLRQEEIKYLSLFIVESGINLDDSETQFNAESIFDNLLVGDEPTPEELTRSRLLRKYICSSNILNYTIVNKIGEGDADENLLAFPAAYKEGNKVNVDKPEWYPVDNWETIDENAWEDCELNRLLIGISELGISASENEINFSINEKMDTLLKQSKIEPKDIITNEVNSKLDVIYHSDIMAMTISERLNQTGSVSSNPNVHNIEIPSVTHNGQPIYDSIEGRISADDKVIVEEEVELLLRGITEVLGINFFTEGSSATFEYDSILNTISISELNSTYGNGDKTRLDGILDSTILHYIISDNLIFQNQKVSENVNGTMVEKSYAIVTKAYFSNSGLTAADKVVVENNYVAAIEIKNAINALGGLGINSIETISTINKDHLKQYFAPKDSANEDEKEAAEQARQQLINDVCASAILSKIFSQILVSNGIWDIINMIPGNSYSLKQVEQANDNQNVSIITQQDLSDILTKYGSMF